jgi:putative holliday junction resolvase
MIYDSLHDFASAIPPEGALLGIDYGRARIGIAACDATRIIASPREVYKRRNISKDIGHIARIVRENNAVGFVIGLPLAQDGSEGENCAEVRLFAGKLLKKPALPILFYDERFSTAAVTRSMQDAGVNRKNRQAVDDKLAASYILQCVLDMLKRQ